MSFLKSSVKISQEQLAQTFSELIYINKIRALNELDLHLKLETIFFLTSNTKKWIFLLLLQRYDHAPHDQEKLIRKIISLKIHFNTPHDILSQKSEKKLISLSLHIFWLVKQHYLAFQV